MKTKTTIIILAVLLVIASMVFTTYRIAVTYQKRIDVLNSKIESLQSAVRIAPGLAEASKLYIKVLKAISQKEIEPELQTKIASAVTEQVTIFAKYIDAPFILSVIEQESNFNPNAVSDKEAYGLMQILPSTAIPYYRLITGMDDIENIREKLKDPVLNIKIGSYILADLIRMYLSEGYTLEEARRYALFSYFWGPGELRDRKSKKQDIVSDYDSAVLNRYSKWRTICQNE